MGSNYVIEEIPAEAKELVDNAYNDLVTAISDLDDDGNNSRSPISTMTVAWS